MSLEAEGAAAYLDARRLIETAQRTGCDAIHPGYGFLSESAGFSLACEEGGLAFVGPTPASLSLLGDKGAAREAAQACLIPVLPGLNRPVTVEQATEFLISLGDGAAVMLKAVAGGGGRGMRAVRAPDEMGEVFQRCSSEALQAFGAGDLYVEELLPRARHVEVQIIGDGRGGVSHLWDRECSLQRRRQKIIEIAPAFGISQTARDAMLAAAVQLGRYAELRGLCTVEFLVDSRPEAEGAFVFMEANPRIQVEHTVTEAILGIDLVAAQLRIAQGASLLDLGLNKPPAAQGAAVQLRVMMERMAPDGSSAPTGGVIEVYEPPSGPNLRVDGFGYAGYETSPRYDSLLAKVIVHGSDLAMAASRAQRALSGFRVEGVGTNIGFLGALLKRGALTEPALHTRYIDEAMPHLIAETGERQRFFSSDSPALAAAGASVDLEDPLAVLNVRPTQRRQAARPSTHRRAPVAGPPGTEGVYAPMQGTVLSILSEVGTRVRRGQTVAVLEALKMEHAITAETSGVVRQVAASPGAALQEGAPLLFVEPLEVDSVGEVVEVQARPGAIRPDLSAVDRFHELTTDVARASAAEKRRAAGKRTARENIEDLCDPDTFLEYGALVLPARRGDESREELEQRLLKAPGDGLVMGVGRVNGDLFGVDRSRCAVLSYDYSVFAGTQGRANHQKSDRMMEVAEANRLPVIFFTEGGGGRTFQGYPGDPRPPPTTLGGIKQPLWQRMGRLSGLVPMVGIATGFCFAGNAVALALCDVIIATRDASIGIGGPAMIEGGGLGRYAPEEVGPVSIQEPNGVIDIVVDDEVEAVAVAKRYLGYFQGRATAWAAPDQRALRQMIPENRRRPYDVRKVIETIADVDSVLELRRNFGTAVITALARIEGRPVGVIASNNMSPTGGAVDADAADKAARFMQLCDAFDIPLTSLLDVPGNMVGPEAEKTATVRHCGRLYVIGANLEVPLFAVVLRKAYGLGAMAMTGGGFHVPSVVVSWPTGEFAPMGLEGQIKLGRRAELAAIDDIPTRKAKYEEMLGQAYAWSSALNGATVFEFDDVIDPAETRRWLVMGLEAAPAPHARAGKKRSFIDTW